MQPFGRASAVHLPQQWLGHLYARNGAVPGRAKTLFQALLTPL